MSRRNKLKTAEQFRTYASDCRNSLQNRNQQKSVHICTGGGCIASGSMETAEAFEKGCRDAGIEVSIKKTGCMGPCSKGPVIRILPDNIIYEGITAGEVPRIIQEHLINGTIVDDFAHKQADEIHPAKNESESPFFSPQEKIVLQNCGSIDPLDIEEYIAVSGYQALAAILEKWTSDQVIQELKESGLRGRGGAGFPTWLKWNFTCKAAGRQKYVLCNADEGDPGAFMDRSVLEGDPHSVIEGMAIAGFTVGANQGYVYVRAEYPLAIARLQKAIEQHNVSSRKFLVSGFPV